MEDSSESDLAPPSSPTFNDRRRRKTPGRRSPRKRDPESPRTSSQTPKKRRRNQSRKLDAEHLIPELEKQKCSPWSPDNDVIISSNLRSVIGRQSSHSSSLEPASQATRLSDIHDDSLSSRSLEAYPMPYDSFEDALNEANVSSGLEIPETPDNLEKSVVTVDESTPSSSENSVCKHNLEAAYPRRNRTWKAGRPENEGSKEEENAGYENNCQKLIGSSFKKTSASSQDLVTFGDKKAVSGVQSVPMRKPERPKLKPSETFEMSSPNKLHSSTNLHTSQKTRKSQKSNRQKVSDNFATYPSPLKLKCASTMTSTKMLDSTGNAYRIPRKNGNQSKISDNFLESTNSCRESRYSPIQTRSKQTTPKKCLNSFASKVLSINPELVKDKHNNKYKGLFDSLEEQDDQELFQTPPQATSLAIQVDAKSPKSTRRANLFKKSPSKTKADCKKVELSSKNEPLEKVKASSVFDADELMKSEYRLMMESAPAKAEGKHKNNARKRYFNRMKKVFSGLQGDEPKKKSPVKKSRKETKNDAPNLNNKVKLDKGQKSIEGFLSPRSSSIISSTSDEDSTNEDEDVWNQYVLKIEEVLASQDTADDSSNMEEYLQMMQARTDAMKREDEAVLRTEYERKEKEIEWKKFRDENRHLGDRLNNELDETKTREMVRKNFSYIQDVWDGKVASSRYSAFQRGGRTRHALLYCMITSPFDDAQVDWIMDEITCKWMPTRREQTTHADFVWKVVVAETLIKIYADHFGFDKAEAENRMRNTPSRPDEG